MRGDSFGSEYKPLDKQLIRRLMKYLKPYKKWVALALLLTILSAALSPLRPYLTKIAIDDYISLSDWSGLQLMVIVIFAAIIVNGAIQFSMTYIMQWVGQKVLFDIRTKLFDHINKLSVSYFDKNPVGRLVTRLTNDVEGLNQLFSQGVVMILADIMLIFWIIGFMFYTNVELSLLTLTILPALLVVTSVFRKKVRVLFRDLRKELAAMNSFISENLSGISTLKLFTQEESQYNKFDKINSNTRLLNVKTIFYYALFFPTVELLSSIALGIVIWYAAGNILGGVMTIGTLIAFLQYSEMFFRPVRDLSEKYTTLQSAMASAERIVDLLDEDNIEESSKSLLNIDTFNSEIEFKNVSFSYDESKPVLKDVSFTIKKGTSTAIVGATGSGKTTIINLLCKFYDYNQGEILFDGIDIRQINNQSLRDKIALVMQDVFLFSRSVSENICLGCGKENLSLVKNAANAIGADKFIDKLPESYATELSERGMNFSAGERQLLSFSRAFAANPDILILDEATSNIDSESEVFISNSLEKLSQNRTSIIIAHRLSTIQKADNIIVLHKGRVQESGKHEQLMKKGGIYAKLYQLQIVGNNVAI